jgi:arylsulfatase A-like enzyme
MTVTNAFRVSYPGYAEMLTGHPQDAVIDGNVDFQNPSETVLEFARQKLNLDRSQVALFASWNAFLHIGESKPGTITINAGYQAFEGGERMRDLSRGQFLALSPWDEERHDYFTFEMALEYLRTVKPRVLFISFDETDDWAHDKRYDRVLDSIHYLDQCLRELFATLDAMPEYKGSTSVIVTTDHGRGSKLDDWSDHGKKVAGAEQVWMAIAGPDTPARGEITNAPEIHQRDIAPTILELLGIDAAGMKGIAGSRVP